MLRLGIDGFDGTEALDSRSIIALFYANWCPFCTRFLRLFEEAMQERENPVGALVDISDMDNPLWQRFCVNIVPTLVRFKNRKTLVRKNGVAGVGLSVQELEETLQEMR